MISHYSVYEKLKKKMEMDQKSQENTQTTRRTSYIIP